MSLRVRTFEIRSGGRAVEDEELVSAFLRSVRAEKIETAFANDGWRLLVIYDDLKEKEESAQIASAIAAELKTWRADVARNLGVGPVDVLSEEQVLQVARFVPTTPPELRLVLGMNNGQQNAYENEIVHVVRQALDDLI